MTNRLELNWKLDGFVDEQRYYCSETPIDLNSLPAPKAVLANDARTYIDATIEVGKTYFVRVGSVKNGIEKFSDEVVINTMPTPLDLNPASYFDADDITDADVAGWVCRITGVAVTTSTNKPILSTELGFKTCKFGASSSLVATNALLANLMTAKSAGSVFIVFKKDIFDTSAQSRRLFNITTPSSTARFAVYADDRSTGNMNKIVVGGRRLDSDTYRYLATTETVDTNTHMVYADVDHSLAQFCLSIDSSTIFGGTQQGVGATSATSGTFVLGGGAGGAGFVGHLACVIFFDRILTVAERQSLEGWAAHKYGLIDNLPSDHPYKILVPVI